MNNPHSDQSGTGNDPVLLFGLYHSSLFPMLLIASLLLIGIWALRMRVDRKKPVSAQPSGSLTKNPRRLGLEEAIRTIAGKEVSQEKMDALCLESSHALIEARAGSGKTQTLALRAALAIRQGMSPQQSILLSFNRSAARELSERLAVFNARNVPVSTFHGLAYQIVRPRPENLLYGDAQHALIRRLIMEKLSKDKRLWKESLIHDHTDEMRTFISSAKHRGFSPEDVQRKCGSANDIVSCVSTLYAAYTHHLKTHRLLDFDDLIEMASEKLSTLTRLPVVRLDGNVCDLNNLHLLMIDEFQDFSRSFCRLVQILKDRNHSLGIYAVGDAWQAINAFAGSDSRFFHQFETFFPGAARAQLLINYRSRENIVTYSNAWMRGEGTGGIALREGGTVEEVTAQPDRIGTASIHQALKTLIVQERRHSVLVLARRNICYGRDLLAWQKDFSSLHSNVRVSTIHRAKGGEADVVLFLKESALNGSLSWLDIVLGQTEEETRGEEKRLVYVAITRAKERLVVIG